MKKSKRAAKGKLKAAIKKFQYGKGGIKAAKQQARRLKSSDRNWF